MDGSAPKELLQHNATAEKQLHQNVATNATQAGHPITAAEVDPEAKDYLARIGKDFGEKMGIVGYAADINAKEFFDGDNPASTVREVEGRKGLSIFRDKVQAVKDRLLKKAA